MLLAERETKIVAMVNQKGACTVRALAEHFGVTEVTIRRDLTKLESLRLLKRTHGGAVSLENGRELALLLANLPDVPEEPVADALILAPIQNRAAHALRERAVRNQIPFLAESCPQEGAIYVGPENYDAAFALGEWAGQCFLKQFGRSAAACAIDITQAELTNARERSAGFSAGFGSIVDNCVLHSIDGHGIYSDAHPIVREALRLHPEVNVMFGINDDSIMAGIHAYSDLERDPDRLIAVNVGGEGSTLLDTLARNGPLKACLGLFPDVVGHLAIDSVVRLWRGDTLGDQIITPRAILTPDNLADYYVWNGQDWELLPARKAALLPAGWPDDLPAAPNNSISFVILYRSHEWYQNLAKAMRIRADELNIDFDVRDVKDDLHAEIRELRRMIGKLAASYVEDGDTIILDAGATTNYMARFLGRHQHLTVITNSMEIFQYLHTYPNIELIMTGGAYDRETKIYTGRGAHLLLNDIRAGKAFIAAEGVSPHFGISSSTENMAEIERSMIRAAREVIVLADHTILDIESNYHVADLDEVDTLITDAGIPASQNLELTQRGIRVLLAGRVEARD